MDRWRTVSKELEMKEYDIRGHTIGMVERDIIVLETRKDSEGSWKEGSNLDITNHYGNRNQSSSSNSASYGISDEMKWSV